MENEIAVLESDELLRFTLSDFNEKGLPALIHEQVDKLNELDVSIKHALESAESARESAIEAERKSAGFGKKRVAIEELQTAGLDLAKAVQSGAEAQKISFEFQTKLAEISKYLFGLGVSNIASNRFVVRELELKLKDASEEEISELARQELMLVVKQLKEQEDILIKLENLSKTLKGHHETLGIQYRKNQSIDEQLHTHAKADKRNSEQLGLQVEASKRFKEQLEIQAKVDKKHSSKLKEHEEFVRLHSTKLEEHEEVDKQLEKQLLHVTEKHDKASVNLNEKNDSLHEEIKFNLKMIEDQQNEIKTLNEAIHSLGNALDTKAGNSMSKVGFAVAASAFILSVIQFFI